MERKVLPVEVEVSHEVTPPTFYVVSQPESPEALRTDGFLGTGNGYAESLMELRLYDRAMVETVLKDLGRLGTWFSGRTELVELVAPFLGPKGANIAKRAAIYYMGGKPERRENKVRNVLRDKFLEYSVFFSHLNTIHNPVGKKHAKLSKRGRVGEGRGETPFYVPSEGETAQVLKYLCFGSPYLLSSSERKDPKISYSLSILKYLQTDFKFDVYLPVKPFDVMTDKAKFCGFYQARELFNRKVDVSRDSIRPSVSIIVRQLPFII